MVDHKIRSAAVVAAPAVTLTPAPASPERVAPPKTAAHPFAELLRQNHLAATKTPPSDTPNDKAAAAPTPVAKPQSNEATPPEPAASQRDATQAKARTTGSSRTSARSSGDRTNGADASTPAQAGPATGNSSKDTPANAGNPGAEAATLASAQAAAAQSADFRAGDDRPGGGSVANSGAGPALLLNAGTSQGADAGTIGDRRVGVPVADDATAQGEPSLDKTADASAVGSFATLLADTKPAPAPGSLADRTGHNALAQTVQPAGFAAPAAATASSAAAAASTLPVPVHSPEFAAAFGMQVSVLAKDGIQHAELHLNPADMGPVSIQITLDGSQARVDFGADVAATRHAIEAGLPELASALRDAGFTLAGGGVAQHSSGSDGDDRNSRQGTSAAPAAAVASLDATAQRLNRRVAAGGVDVYA